MSTDLDELVALVSRRLGLPAKPGRAEELRGPVERAMQRAGVDDIVHFLAAVHAGSVGIDEIVETLTVRETYFFRHAGQFELLRTRIVPELRKLLRRRAQLRVWCAGCATGEEPYSLAMLLAEDGLLEHVHILATDVSHESLERARRAHYGSWSFRETPPSFAARWFRRVEDGHTIDEAIRKRVSFEPLNLVSDPYPSLANGTWGLDLILCRNVLLYFDDEAIGRAALRFHDALREGGWLMTGPSDPSLEALAPFEVSCSRTGMLYRRHALSARAAEPPRRRRRTTGRRPLPPARVPAAVASESEPLSRARAAYQAGDWDATVKLARQAGEVVEARVLEVRALANLGQAVQAEAAARQALAVHELTLELHFLRALLLLTLGRENDALECARRVIFLDRSFVVGHFLLGELQARLGQRRGARIAYRNALELCRALPAETVLPLGDGHTAGRMAGIAEEQLSELSREEGAA